MKKYILELKNILKTTQLIENADLTNFNTYHIKCIVKLLVIAKNEKELINVVNILNRYNIKFFVLGGGSNVLFRHKKLKEVVVCLRENIITQLSDNKIKVFAGTQMQYLIKYCLKNALSGIEWASHIPATLGGAIIMNMGAFNHNIATLLTEVVYYKNNKIYKKTNLTNCFSYRNSVFKNNECIILSATLKLEKASEETIKENIKTYTKLKMLTQPIFNYSCGSVFKNGKDYFVAELIEKSGLKGYSVGGAEISKLHSNFIINKNNATGYDVFVLIKYIKKVIQKHYNVCILCEVVIK